jgi:membrane associated rhomboid family serine protease
MIALHTIPFLSIYANLILTDITMVPSDWKMVAVVGASYQIANIIGCLALGGPLYPYLNWNNKPLTSLGYTAIGLLMGWFFNLAAKYTQNRNKT